MTLTIHEKIAFVRGNFKQSIFPLDILLEPGYKKLFMLGVYNQFSAW